MKIEGRNPVHELLNSDMEITKIYLQSHIVQDTKINGLVKKAKRKGIKVIHKDRKELDSLSDTNSHQGVIAYIKYSHNTSLNQILQHRPEKGNLKFIYIREANHDHNIGAIIRTAEAAGFDGVILPRKIHMTTQIVRASMGAALHIPVFNESLFNLIKSFKSEGIKVVGIERDDKAIKHTEADLNQDILLIVGGEDKVLSEEILKKCDETIYIKQYGKVNSLNMSVAAGISMFEVLRQQSL